MNTKSNQDLLFLINTRLSYIERLLRVDEKDPELRATCNAEITQVMLDLTTLKEQLN